MAATGSSETTAQNGEVPVETGFQSEKAKAKADAKAKAKAEKEAKKAANVSTAFAIQSACLAQCTSMYIDLARHDIKRHVHLHVNVLSQLSRFS